MPAELIATAGPRAPEIPGLTPEQQLLAAIVYGSLFLVGTLVNLAALIWVLNRPPRVGRRMARLLRRPVSLTDAAELLVLLVLLLVVAGGLARFTPLQESTLLALQSLLFHWLLIFLFARALRQRQVSARRAFGLARSRLAGDAVIGALGYLGMVPAFLIVAALYGLLLKAFGYEPALQPVTEILTSEARPWMLAYLLFVVVVLAPIAEELVFRGVILPLLARYLGVWPAAALVSLIFALVHFHAEAVLPLFVASMCFSAAYALTGRLAVSMVMHGLFNGVNLAVILIGAA